MFMLKVIGSSSAGNCYILENDTEALVIECGCKIMDVKRALDFNISKVVGALISHEHGDHSKFIRDYLKAGIPVYTSDATQESLNIITGELPIGIPLNKSIMVGNFSVQPFELVHDVPCVGYYIKHPDIGKLLFITDTEYVPQNFSKLNINHILVEANYSNEKIDHAKYNRDHVLTGHMSIDTACEFLSSNDNPHLRNVVITHLSYTSSNEKEFLQKARQAVQSADVYIADKGLEVNLNLVPFMD